jgi:hypothetical protein
MNYTTDFKSIRAEVSPEEWQARVDLAACYRLVDKYGMPTSSTTTSPRASPAARTTC